MKKIFVLAGVALAAAGCMSPEYLTRSAKPNMNSANITQYEPKEYTVLGPVTASANSRSILGIIAEGHEGQGLLWEAARTKYGDKVTGIKDISVSYDYTAILAFVYNEVRTTYTGIAVSEK